MFIKDLPNIMTEKDSSYLKKLSETSLIGDIYKKGVRYSVERYDSVRSIYHGFVDIHDMETLKRTRVPFSEKKTDLMSFLPTEDLIFKEYKKELIIAPLFIDGELNVSDKGVRYYIDNLFVDEDDARKYGSKNEFIIYEPKSLTFINYENNKEAPYFTVTINGTINVLNSLDLALKSVFEFALYSCDYMPVVMLERIKKLDEKLTKIL